VIEALACGLPVVTTDVGGNSEIVRPHLDGLLVPFGDPDALLQAVREGLQIRWDRDAMSRRARVRTWDQTARQVAAEFEAVLATRVRPSRGAVAHPAGGGL
jgi:glycosyltransferase involved in cell wall biosynthesis